MSLTPPIQDITLVGHHGAGEALPARLASIENPFPVTLAAGSAAVGSLTAGEAHIGQVQTIEAAAGLYLLYPQ